MSARGDKVSKAFLTSAFVKLLLENGLVNFFFTHYAFSLSNTAAFQ